MDRSHPQARETQSNNNYISRPRSTAWNMMLDEPLRSRALEAALFVAERMRNPEEVQRIAQAARAQSQISPYWDLSFPSAAAELALFYHGVARCFPDANWQETMQSYLKVMAMSSQQHALASPALFGGISGVAFVVQQCSKEGRNYQQTLIYLHQNLSEQVHRYFAWHHPPEMGVAESDFDLVSGASGILGYLTHVPTPDRTTREMLHILLNYLLTLTEPGQIRSQESWFCPPSRFVSEHDRQSYPHGRFNCGLAHGIPGPLSALSLTLLDGYDHPDLRASLAYLSHWLIQHQIQDEGGITWPTAIPYERASSPEQWCMLPASRAAWCYGTPGVARSLWLAGHALKDEYIAQVALDALRTVLHRSPLARKINTPTLCHGNAGLLLICLHFAHESQDPFLLEQIPVLVEHILAQFNLQSPLGFRDIEPTGKQVDRPNFLTGAPGTALALLAAASSVAPSWDRLLLLS